MAVNSSQQPPPHHLSGGKSTDFLSQWTCKGQFFLNVCVCEREREKARERDVIIQSVVFVFRLLFWYNKF